MGLDQNYVQHSSSLTPIAPAATPFVLANIHIYIYIYMFFSSFFANDKSKNPFKQRRRFEGNHGEHTCTL